MRLQTLFSVAALTLGLWPAPSRAAILFTLGNNPQPGEENVLLGNGTSGNTIFGETNQSHSLVRFDSTQALLEPANGQARIEATDGADPIGLTNVTITTPGGTYQDLIFNPSITGTVGGPGGVLSVSVTDSLNSVSSFDYLLSSGENFLTIVATAGQSIVSTRLSYGSPGGFTDLRQIRISGVQGTVVPEPSSLVMVGIAALGLVGGIGRLRAARGSTARQVAPSGDEPRKQKITCL